MFVCGSALLQPVRSVCVASERFFFIDHIVELLFGIRRQRVDERLCNPLQGNLKPLLVKGKVGKPQLSLVEQVNGI